MVVVRHASRGGAPIAAGLTFRTGPMVEVPWASSIHDFNALCPNHLLYWSVIETAIADGCTTLDFGRSTPNEGTYKFKAQWGADAGAAALGVLPSSRRHDSRPESEEPQAAAGRGHVEADAVVGGEPRWAVRREVNPVTAALSENRASPKR